MKTPLFHTEENAALYIFNINTKDKVLNVKKKTKKNFEVTLCPLAH